MQVHFTGGEPLVRDDLAALIFAARRADLYTNLITSGIPLELPRLEELVRAGLDHVQLSFQGHTEASTETWARHPGFARKKSVASWVKDLGLPLTINVVLHRGNIEDVPEIVAFALELGAGRLELANTQYLGWALVNRAALLPARAELERARERVAAARAAVAGRMAIDFVVPDYHLGRPRACMDGWGRRYVVVSPDGLVLPCHAAHTLPEIRFDDVRTRSLREAWESSDGMRRFRGEEWMPEPCRSCEGRHADFGGCRCQAFHLTADATATDPACDLAPRHDLIEEARRVAEHAPLIALRHRRA
jgi:pyrroloquinoline quinone biosynthesis protein E